MINKKMIFLQNFKLFSRKISPKNTTILRFYHPRRALLYVPGNSEKMIQKSVALDVDCIALDCEDGVALNKKDEARNTIRNFLENGKPSKGRSYDLGVRINSFDTIFFKDDIKSCLTAKNLPDTILLPKVDYAEHIEMFSEEISKYIPSNNKVNLIVYIESAIAFLNIIDICKKCDELSKKTHKFQTTSLVFGSDDFLANIGATRTENSLEVIYARQKLVLVAKAFGLQAIDMVYIKYKDLEGLKRQSEEGMRMGYTGKQVIHPGQVSVVQESFLPSKQQIQWAEGLILSFEEHQRTGKGAFTYEGSMIDMPTVKQAQNIVDLVNSIKPKN